MSGPYVEPNAAKRAAHVRATESGEPQLVVMTRGGPSGGYYYAVPARGFRGRHEGRNVRLVARIAPGSRDRSSRSRRRDPQVERRYSGQLALAIEPEEDGYRATIYRNGEQVWEGWFRQRLVRGVEVESDAWYDEVAATALERANEDEEIDAYAELSPRGSYDAYVVGREPTRDMTRSRPRRRR